MVNAPFRECVVFPLCDPNVSVRRIEASFRKRGNSLSGNPCQRYVGGSVARGFFFLSVLLVCPTFAVMLLCSRQSFLWRSRLRADLVLVFLLSGENVLYDAVAMHFVLCFFPVVRPEMLGIMAGMDQEAWFAGFRLCPSRGAPLGVSCPRCPSSWPAWTTGQCGGSQVQFLDKVFLHSRCCATCVLVQTVFYTVAFSAVAVLHGLRCCFHAVFPFVVGRPVLPSVMHGLDHSLEVQFLDRLFSPVVVLRQVPFMSGQCAALPVETL